MLSIREAEHCLSDFNYCTSLKDMLSQSSITWPDESKISIHSTSTANNLRAIRFFILQEKPTSTLEIGLAYGASALAFLCSLREVQDDNFFHIAIDPYQEESWGNAGHLLIQQEGLDEKFQLISKDSSVALPELLAFGQQFQMIYIDGSHTFENVFIDFFFSIRLLDDNGLILFDDCTTPQVKKVIKFIDMNYAEILKREAPRQPNQNKTWNKRLGNLLGIQQLVAYRKIGSLPRQWDRYSNF